MTSLNRLQKPVLVLNASYEPINICAARRALVRLTAAGNRANKRGDAAQERAVQ